MAAVALAAFLIGGQVASRIAAAPVRPGVERQVSSTDRAATGGDDAARRQAEAAGIDVDGVVEAISHRVTADAGRPDVLVARDDAYHASFDDGGLHVAASEGEPASFGVSLTGVFRGGQQVTPQVGDWTGRANVAERSVAAGATERVTAHDGRLEWDVVLSSPPAGTGALHLEATVRGDDPKQVGTAWRWKAGGGHVDMGEMVVVDASGAELFRSLPTVVGDRVTLEVPGEVLAEAAYPVTIDPPIGPEFPVNPDAVFGPTRGEEPEVAFDGTNFLVAWGGDEVRVARVSQAGVVLDEVGIRLSGFGGVYPTLVFDGTNYFVAWATTCCSSGGEIRGARVSPSGTALDPGGIVIAPATIDLQVHPAIAFDGTNYLVVWSRDAFANQIMAARVDKTGSVLAPGLFSLGDSGSGVAEPSVAFGGGNYLVTFGGVSTVDAVRVAPSGTVLAPGRFAVSATPGTKGRATVAFNGTDWFVTWADWRSGTSFDIYGARVTPAGTVTDPAGIPIATTSGDELDAAVARNGTDVLVVWHAPAPGGDAILAGARVSAAGVVLDPTPITVATTDGLAVGAVAGGGGIVLAVFEDFSSAGAARTVRVDAAGTVLDPSPQLVSQRANAQISSQVAFDGTNYLVVWADDRNVRNVGDVFAARVSSSGAVLDPDAIPISVTPGRDLANDVIFDGTNFVVAWSIDGDGAFVTRIGTDGVVLDAAPIRLPGPALGGQVDLSADSTNTLAVWTANRPGTGDDILAARISPSGAVLDPTPVVVAGQTVNERDPAVAFDGTNHLVVHQQAAGGFNDDLVARRVGTGGAVLDPTALPIATTPDFESEADLAWGGHNYFVVWRRLSVADNGRRVMGARVGTNGQPIGPGAVRISTAEDEQGGARVAGLNGWFLVTWTRRTGATFDVMGARIHENGTMTDPAGFLISPGSGADVTTADGRWAVTYERVVEPGYGTLRLFVRTVAPK